MQTVFLEPTFETWREQSRALLAAGQHPDEVIWAERGADNSLFPECAALPPSPGQVPKVSSAFLDIARTAAAHTDPQRWTVLYRVLWRLTCGGERHLLSIPTDRDVRTLQNWCKAIGRDIHKMHAFVRFRLVGTDEVSGREQFVAWF